MNGMWAPEHAGAWWVATIAVMLACFALWIFLQWRVFAKAGFPGALALINLGMFIPLIGPLIPVGLLAYLAFAEWPALKQPPQA